MVYGDFKSLARITASDKVLRDKAFDIVENPKYDGYQRGLSSMVYKFFDKKTQGSGAQQLAEELRKPIIKTFSKRRVYSSFKDNIWGADLVDMQLNLIKDLDFYDASLIFLVNMHGLFL